MKSSFKSILILFFFIFTLKFPLYSETMFFIKGGYQTVSLDDLEAGLNFWNDVVRELSQTIEGWNVSEIPLIYGKNGFPYITLGFEKTISKKLSLEMGFEMIHFSIKPHETIGDLQNRYFILDFCFNESADSKTPYITIKYSIAKKENLSLKLGLSLGYQMLSWKMDSNFLWEVEDPITRNKLINTSSFTRMDLDRSILRATPLFEVEKSFEKLFIRINGGYRFSKSGEIKVNYAFETKVLSIFHEPIVISNEGSATLWIGEISAEFAGQTYYYEGYIFQENHPEGISARKAVLNLSGLFLEISVGFNF